LVTAGTGALEVWCGRIAAQKEITKFGLTQADHIPLILTKTEQTITPDPRIFSRNGITGSR